MYNGKQLRALLIPLIVEQLLVVLVGMADVLMVSVLGEDAVAGVSLVDAVNNLVLQVLYSVSAGGTVVCARYMGAKMRDEAGRTGGQLFFLTTVAMLMFSAFCLCGNRKLLSAIFGQIEDSVMENSLVYMRWTALSFPLMAVYNSGAAMFRAQGNTKRSMQVTLMMNAVNISGNAICIFGLHMGVEGVGIPTLIARGLAAVIITALLQKEEGGLHIDSFSYLVPHRELIRKILAIGIPNGMESAIFQMGKLMLQSLVSTLGTASIAAFAVASNLATYFYLPGNALGAGLLTIAGQCYGAGEKAQARYYANKLLKINYIMVAFICAAFLAGSSFWVRCYHLSGTAAALAAELLRSHVAAMLLWPVAFLYPYYFRAIGRPGFTMVVSITTMWLFRIGLAYVFIHLCHMNVLGIWYAMYTDWAVRVVIYLMALKKMKV